MFTQAQAEEFVDFNMPAAHRHLRDECIEAVKGAASTVQARAWMDEIFHESAAESAEARRNERR